jgi:hypothetical protein
VLCIVDTKVAYARVAHPLSVELPLEPLLPPDEALGLLSELEQEPIQLGFLGFGREEAARRYEMLNPVILETALPLEYIFDSISIWKYD